MKRQKDNTASSPGVELFPIRTVSSLTGVNSITLRAWERRYGLIRPVRTPTGHRLYRREEIDLIHRVVALLDKGISISQVQRALERRTDGETALVAPEEQRWAGERRRLLTAVIRFDEDTLDDVYNEALALSSIEHVTHRLLIPLLEELDRRSANAEGVLAEKRFFSVFLRNKLGARLHHRGRGNSGPRFLSATLPGEQEDLEVLLFALTAREYGLRPVVLGAHTPLVDLKTPASRTQCAAIVLSGSSDNEPELLAEQVAALVHSVMVPVFVSGLTSIRQRDRLVAAGAVPLGNDLKAGAKRVLGVLNNFKPTPSVPAHE